MNSILENLEITTADNYYFYAMIIGFAGLCLTVYSYQRKEARQIFFVQIFSPLIWATHFCMIGATAGFILNLTDTLKALGIVFLHEKYIKKFILFYLILVWLVFFLYVFENFSDLAILASR